MKRVYRIETAGRYSATIEIHAEVNREFNKNDDFMFGDMGEKIIQALFEESARLDPEKIKQGEEERREIISLFDGREIFVEEIPNEYCDRYCCKHRPWFIITTKKGRIKIGWRKRVINISWDYFPVKKTAEELFPKENVTKDTYSIHADDYEKAQEYINKILF